jgi:TatD DNase family protein
MIDSHCHLADDAFVDDLEVVVDRAKTAGVRQVVCILSADEPDELARAERLARLWPAVRFAAGVHPHRGAAYAGRPSEAASAARTAADRVKAAAIGEIGLDYHYDFAPRDVQREVFAAQVALAVERDQPVVIHTREATEDTLAVLREAGRGRVRGVFHCFSGTRDEARQGLDLGFSISLSGILTFPRADALREVARFVPADRLLVETDAPFLAPVPHRGKRNEPAWVAETLGRLAAIRSVSTGEMSQQVADNLTRLLGPAA